MADDFATLPQNLQKRIDNAFKKALGLPSSEESPRPRKRRKLDDRSEVATGSSGAEDEPGGFIIDDSDAPGGFVVEVTAGGFIAGEDILPKRPTSDNLPSEDEAIPFTLIPTALQILDLQPDDEEVLQVFRNAATGWSNGAKGQLEHSEDEDNRLVSREDWRAVCAVLLGSGDDGEESPSTLGEAMGTPEAKNSEFNEQGYGEDEEDEEEDVYKESSLSSMSGSNVASDSDEYYEVAATSRSKLKSENRKGKRKVPSRITLGAPTPRQKQIALETFALFFQSTISDSDLLNKRLMFKDLVKVSDILKEKLKAEEINEMLSLFSTSPDNTMSLDDFTRMMITAKLA
ncbi:hypothetical protein BU17DRAFT_99933 [Hysterangium stoloniferum]|nr:hypothetical protein BU17DRAFT_99933 [Hysterangium stoloniferum]